MFNEKREHKVRAAARKETYYADDVQIPDDGNIRETDDGCWVQAWVWVNANELADES